MTNRLIPVALLFLTAILWSLGGVLIKSIDWHPMALAGARSAIAIPILLLCLPKPRFTFSGAQIGGALALALTIWLFVLATKMTTAANAIFLQYTAPIYVAIIGRWYLGERAHRVDWLVIGVALSGIALFFMDRLTLSGLQGNLLALAAGVTFAFMPLFLRKEKDASPGATIILGNVLVLIAGVPFMFGPPPVGNDWWQLIALGIFQLGLAYVLYATAIKYVTALEASLIPLIEPVLNPLWVMLALGEKPGAWAMLGGILVLGAVVVRGIVMAAASRGGRGD